MVGTNEEAIYNAFKLLLENEEKYEAMSKESNPYEDGFDSKRIADILELEKFELECNIEVKKCK